MQSEAPPPLPPRPLRTLDLLLVLFIGLRLAGVIEWPWAAVLAPLWVPLAAGIALDIGKAGWRAVLRWLARS